MIQKTISVTQLLRHFLAPFRLSLFGLFVIVSAAGIVPFFDAYLSKMLIDQVSFLVGGADADLFFKKMWVWIIGYPIYWESINWLWRAYDYLYLKTLAKVKGNVIQELFDKIQQHDHTFFQENMTGFISNRVLETARSIEMVFSILNERLIRKSVILIAAIYGMYSVHSQLALVFLVWLIFFMGLSVICAPYIKKLSTEFGYRRSSISGQVVDSITNIFSVRVFSNYRYESKHIGAYIKSAVEADQGMQWYMLKLRYVLGFSCTVMIGVMVYYMAMLGATGAISVGDFAMILQLCVTTLDEVFDFTQDFGDFFEEIGNFNQGLALLQGNKIQDAKDAKELHVVNGKIAFNSVTFTYKGNQTSLFCEKNVVIKSKQKVGLVGFSGSGKSTFISLIHRLYDVDYGNITIDDQDISKVTQRSLRDNISIIPQEAVLFNRSIMANICYGRMDATEEEVIRAAQLAHIHEDIIKFPDGYNTLCGERGNALSGGQRQRVVIARAILRNTPILLLDEATSALDTITEKHIQESLGYLMRDKTVLVIAHKLSTLLSMDRILVFQHGVIVEDGTHNELIEKDGLYKTLWNSQVGGFIK